MPLTVEVGYGEDQERVLGTIREILMQNGRILKTPEPEVDIVSLADAGVRIALRPWCKAEDYWQVQYEVYRALLERFRQRDIQIAYPVPEIRMRPEKA